MKNHLHKTHVPERAIVRIVGTPIEQTDLGDGSSLVGQSAEVTVTIVGQEPIIRQVPQHTDTSGAVDRSSVGSLL